VKAVRATEVQTYTRADDKCFVVSVTCATPDVPYGGNFVVELQVEFINPCIVPSICFYQVLSHFNVL
jgi:hypothetical protein